MLANLPRQVFFVELLHVFLPNIYVGELGIVDILCFQDSQYVNVDFSWFGSVETVTLEIGSVKQIS